MRKLKVYCIVLLFMAIIVVIHLFLEQMLPSYRVYVQEFMFRPQMKIFVTYHKPYEPSYNILKGKRFMVPIQVGRAVEQEPFMGGKLSKEDISWLHERMIGDDTGDNISSKNREYDVLTAYYWVWKHYKEIGNPKYIGFFAHRKWLNFRALNKYLLGIQTGERDLVEFLDEHKVVSFINYMPENQENGVPLSIYDVYQKDHVEDDLKDMLSLIERDYPDMRSIADEVLNEHYRGYAVWNFWIMDKELAFDYFEKLFHIMFELEKKKGNEIRERDLVQRRAYGYLAERFFAIWLEYKVRRGLNPYFAEIRYL